MRGWLRKLLGEDDGPPKVTLPAAQRKPKADPALHLPVDPRPTGRVEDRREWLCPAMLGKGKKARPCGRPKVPEKASCGRRACRSWASRQKAKQEQQPAKVLSMGGRG